MHPLALAAAGAALVAVAGGPAAAHQRAAVVIERPAEGASVSGTRVDVLLVAGAGQGAAEFTVRLDGMPVDTRGTVGAAAVFTTFRLQPGGRTQLALPLDRGGAHELRLDPLPHGDDPQPAVVRRFTSVPPPSPSPTLAERGDGDDGRRGWLLVAALGAAVLAGVAAYARRGRPAS